MTQPIDWTALLNAARSARQNAYAPYSNYSVGAAILADDQVFSGCNVENASYPVGICAERAALATAVAAGNRHLQAIVVVTSGPPVPPCGMCRQALAEFNADVPIMMVGDEKRVSTTLSRLLPNPFAFKA